MRRLHPPSCPGRREPLPRGIPLASRSKAMSTLDSIETPALLLEEEKMERNCRRMREKLHSAGVVLRPHVKTAKSVEVTQRALDAPAGPITVSTLREAEYFFDHGFRDIL